MLGGGVGAVAGPAAYAVGSGVARGYQGARNLMFGTKDEAIRPYVNSATETVRKAVDMTNAALGRQAVDKSTRRLGDEGMLLDTGDATMGLGQGAIASTTPARGIVRGAVRERASKSAGRLESAANRAMGQGQDIASTMQVKKAVAELDYQPAYRSFQAAKN